MKSIDPSAWPYPRWIAHRGAGALAPENTLAAFRIGASYGYRMFECDVKLSADDVPFLMHDATLERTTNATVALDNDSSAIGGDHPWATLSLLDAGSWHSRRYAGEPLPSFEAVARFCLQNAYCLNIEIKATPGTERRTGEIVARHAALLWQEAAVPPLLTSFDLASLEGARQAQPELPRGLLLDTLWAGWPDAASSLGCIAVVCEQALWERSTVAQAKAAGLRTLSYLANDGTTVQRLIDLETDGIITDRVDLFSPAT